MRWFDFLELYVARRAPRLPAGVNGARAGGVLQPSMGVDGVTLPDDPIQAEPTYDAALRGVRAAPARPHPVRERRGGAAPGAPVPGLRAVLRPLPAARNAGAPRGTSARTARWPTRRRRSGADAFTADPAARPATDFTRRHRLGAERPVDRDAVLRAGPQNPRRHGAVVPHAAARARHHGRRRGRAAGVDPLDGPRRRPAGRRSPRCGPTAHETFVQSGWLRASARKLDARQAARCSSRCRACAGRDARRCPKGAGAQGRPCRSTTRATCTGPARASA